MCIHGVPDSLTSTLGGIYYYYHSVSAWKHYVAMLSLGGDQDWKNLSNFPSQPSKDKYCMIALICGI